MEIMLGVLVSLLMEALKRWNKWGEFGKLFVLASVSLFASLAYTYLARAGLLDTFVSVIGTAAAFYALIIERFKEGSTLRKMID